MTSKLNITIEENIAKAIKMYARARKISVSKIAETYFLKLLKKENLSKNNQKNFVEKYAGIVKGKLKDIDKIKSDYLKQKYSL